jgi:hypothetical protein
MALPATAGWPQLEHEIELALAEMHRWYDGKVIIPGDLTSIGPASSAAGLMD